MEHWGIHRTACLAARASTTPKTGDTNTAARSDLGSTSNAPLVTPRTPDRIVQAYKQTVVGYILEAHAPYPLFKTVECWTVFIDGLQPYTIPDLSTFFPDGRGAHIVHYSSAMSILAKPYHVFYCTPSFAQQFPPNNAIGHLIRSSPVNGGALWPGNVVVLKFADNACTAYDNIDAADVQDIQTHFALFGRQRWV